MALSARLLQSVRLQSAPGIERWSCNDWPSRMAAFLTVLCVPGERAVSSLHDHRVSYSGSASPTPWSCRVKRCYEHQQAVLMRPDALCCHETDVMTCRCSSFGLVARPLAPNCLLWTACHLHRRTTDISCQFREVSLLPTLSLYIGDVAAVPFAVPMTSAARRYTTLPRLHKRV